LLGFRLLDRWSLCDLDIECLRELPLPRDEPPPPEPLDIIQPPFFLC